MMHWPDIDREVLHGYRRARLRDVMVEEGVDHLLATGFDTIRYTTDFRTQIISEGFDWFAAVVGAEGDGEVFVPWIDAEAEVAPEPGSSVTRLHPLPSWAPAVTHPRTWVATVAAVLERRGARRVGYELVPAELLAGLEGRLPGVTFTPVAPALFRAREEKHPLEVELLAAAAAANAAASDALLAAAEPGRSDYDLLGVAMAHLQGSGVEYLTHSLCAVAGSTTGTWFASGRTLAEGDSFFFDIGCYGRGGYASDMARTCFVGEQPDAVVRAHRVLMEAHHAGLDAARPGARASEITAAVNAVLVGNGYPATPYSIGHGVGLRACELPTLWDPHRLDHDGAVRVGSVVAIEPEVLVEVGDRTVVLKVEDNIEVTATGYRLLSGARYADG